MNIEYFQLLTRKRCIEVVDELRSGDDLDRRNASRTLADYCRVILGEIGAFHPGYIFLKYLPIRHRYSLLSTAVPELFRFKKLFLAIEKLRNGVEHNDETIPTKDELEYLIKKIKILNQNYEQTIEPYLKSLDTIPLKNLEKVWNKVVYLYDSLDNYIAADMKGFEKIVKKVRDYFPLVTEFNNYNGKAISDTIVNLMTLESELNELLRQGKEGMKKRYPKLNDDQLQEFADKKSDDDFY